MFTLEFLPLLVKKYMYGICSVFVKRAWYTVQTYLPAVSSYGLCWGCVQSPAPSSSSSPQLSLSQAYGIRNRVPYMMTYRDEPVRAADNIPFEEFVPDSEDFIRVRDQMKKEVQKILTRHVKLFNGLTVNEEHQHSALVSHKSHMVRLDVADVTIVSLLCYFTAFISCHRDFPI